MIRSHLKNFLSPGALAIFLLTAAAGVSLDLWTKQYAVEHLSRATEGYAFIPGWVHFTVLTNTGAVFGLGEGRRPLFITVSVAAVIFLLYLFANSGKQRFYQFILGMLMAGVLGNMYDRLRYGHVRDMIHVLPRWPNLFPWIFNVADVLLCSGVGLMILYSLFHRETQIAPQSQQSAAETDPKGG